MGPDWAADIHRSYLDVLTFFLVRANPSMRQHAHYQGSPSVHSFARCDGHNQKNVQIIATVTTSQRRKRLP